MGRLLRILAFAVAVIAVAALLTPPVYWAARWAIESGTLPQLSGFRFHQYFNRVVLVVAAVGLIPFLRNLGLRHWTDLGLARNLHWRRDLVVGLVVGLVGLWLVALALVLTDQAYIRSPLRWYKLGPIAITAVVVPIIEETLFRGALLGILRKAMSWRWAVVGLSVLFAIVHFLKPMPRGPRIVDVHWHSGFELLPRLFWQFGEPRLVAGGLVTLFLVGWILAYTVVRTRSLFMAIGLHAGWVFALRSFSQLSKRTAPSSWWVGGDLTTGLLPVAFLAATAILLVWLLRKRPIELGPGPDGPTGAP